MKRLGLIIGALLLTAPAQAQIPASYAERAAFAVTTEFTLRVQYAMTKTAVDVIQEVDTVPDHETRVHFAYLVVKGPDVTQRFTMLVASFGSVIIQKDTDGGPVYTTLTDAALSTLVTNIWTKLALAMASR